MLAAMADRAEGRQVRRVVVPVVSVPVVHVEEPGILGDEAAPLATVSDGDPVRLARGAWGLSC